MKLSHTISLAAASAAIALAAPAAAQQEESTIFVQPSSAEAEYVAHVADQLDRRLARTSFPITQQPAGVVRVRFTTNAEGDPENLTLIGDSGSNLLDRAALRAVRRLSDVSPDFADGADRQIQANIVFANSDRQAARMAAQLHEEEAMRIAAARARGEAPVIALTLGATALPR